MDSGDVEFSGGAVDYNPNESPNKDSGGPVDSMPAAKVAAEDVHFHASDIAKSDNNDFFDNPKKRKQREKEEQRRIRAEAKRIAKESRGRTRKSGASKDVVESEKALKREQSRIENEQRQARLRRFFGAIAKRWYIFATVAAVVAVAVLSVIFVPRIIKGIQDSEKEKYLSENTTAILRVFKEVAGKEMTAEQLRGVAEQYKGAIELKLYLQAGIFYPIGDRMESVESMLLEDGETYGFFSYNKRSVQGDDLIVGDSGGFRYYRRSGGSDFYANVDSAINAYLLDRRERAE